MSGRAIEIRGWPRRVITGLVGALFGAIVAVTFNPLPLVQRTRRFPAPYRMPKIPGGTALRLAMVHDVLHERYLRHGQAWYAKRNQTAKAGVAALHWDDFDDLAVGLDRVGRDAEAIPVLENKIGLLRKTFNVPTLPATRPATQQANYVDHPNDDRKRDFDDLLAILDASTLSEPQRQLYSACADLGTVTIHDALSRLMTGNARSGDKAELRTGLDEIEQAIAINPGSHFGRERWQAIIVEHLLAGLDDPKLITQYDCVGDDLPMVPGEDLHGHAPRAVPPAFDPAHADASVDMTNRLQIRRSIARVGCDPKWVDAVGADYAGPMPFDEPTLAIIGMWTMGGGPSPHFALALGRIMEIVGQRQIAWDAYERAVEMKDRFWPDPVVRDRLVQICRDHQAKIAAGESPGDPDGWQASMRTRHQAELAWGQREQEEYHEFEAARIAAGVALDDPQFDQPFLASHPPIASDPGSSDEIAVTRSEGRATEDWLPIVVLGFGLFFAIAVAMPERGR